MTSLEIEFVQLEEQVKRDAIRSMLNRQNS